MHLVSRTCIIILFLLFKSLAFRHRHIPNFVRRVLLIEDERSGTGNKAETNKYTPVEGDISKLKGDIMRLAALSSRGQVSNEYKFEVQKLIQRLEEENPTKEPSKSPLLLGQWDLIFADDDITRTSPFFWAFKKATKDLKDPRDLSAQFSESVFSFTDAIPIKSIGECYQTITTDSLQSRVQVQVVLAGSSLMTTTSSWRSTEDPNLLELSVEKTQVLDSTVAKLLPFLDADMAFPSGAALELARPGASTVYLRVTYLDEDLRVSRNEDGRVSVFSRTRT